MAEITAGAVSLDLVIKDTLDKQLAGIKSRVENMFGKATEQASSRAQSAIDNVAGSAENATKKVKDIAKGFDVGKVEKSISKMTASLDSASDSLRRMNNYLYSYLESFYRFFAMWNGAKDIQPLDPIAPQAVKNTEKVVEETEQVVNNTQEASEQTEKLTKKTNKLGNSASKVGNISKNVLGGAFKNTLNGAGKIIGTVNSKLKETARNAESLARPVSKLTNIIKNGLRKLFIVAGIMTLLKGLRSAISEAASTNKEFSDSLESIKFNLAVAFQPILTSVMPIINTLMSGISAVTQKIAAFTSALFGTTYKQSAQAVAKSKQAAAAAKNAGKQAKEASKYLADFDEMRVHQENNSESSSGSAEKETDYQKYVTDVKIGDWSKKLKDAIKAGDWNSVGKLLAQKVNGVFDKINWTKIKEKVTKGARKASDGINGFVENLKWKKIGNSIGEGITTAFTFAYTFLKNTKWKSIGSGFANFLNGVMEKTDFDLVGKTLGAKFNALVGLAFGFVTTFNFAKAGTSLSEIINGWFNEVNWAQVGDMISGAIQGAVEFAFSFVDGLDYEKIAESFSQAFNNAVDKIDFKKLGKTVSKAFKGVWDFIAKALEEIDWEDVGKSISDFINGIDWNGILTSMFKVIGETIKKLPELLKGVVENLDFENAAGFFALTFAPKMASHLLSYIRTNSSTKTTLTDAGKEVGSKVGDGMDSKADGAATSFFGKLSNGLKTAGILAEAFSVGYAIGTVIRSGLEAINLTEPIDNAIEKYLDSSYWGEWLKKLTGAAKQAEQAEANWDKLSKKNKEQVAKYENLGIKRKTGEDYNDYITRARAEMASRNNRTYIPTTSDLIKKAQDDAYNKTHQSYKANYSGVPTSVPKLASGGIVKAPTLAFVGDNSDVNSNPEVVAPLSELQQLMGSGGDVAKYLQQIIMLLETMQFVFNTEIDGKELFRTIVSQNKSYKARTGVSAF